MLITRDETSSKERALLQMVKLDKQRPRHRMWSYRISYLIPLVFNHALIQYFFSISLRKEMYILQPFKLYVRNNVIFVMCCCLLLKRIRGLPLVSEETLQVCTVLRLLNTLENFKIRQNAFCMLR